VSSAWWMENFRRKAIMPRAVGACIPVPFRRY